MLKNPVVFISFKLDLSIISQALIPFKLLVNDQGFFALLQLTPE